MSNVSYHVLTGSVVVSFDGKLFSINKDDGRYSSVVEAIRSGNLDTIPELVDTVSFLETSNLKLVNGLLWLDGESLPDAISDRVLAFQKEQLPIEHLVKFARKLRLNPSFNSRLQLFKFLEHNGHPITTEGNFIAYRGVTADFKDKHTGKWDNSIGSICEIERSKVDDNPNNTCSTGLHVACFDYAQGFGERLIEVEVDPRDVVAVPTDYNGTKMRVCKFKVTNICDNIRTESLVDSSYERDTEDYIWNPAGKGIPADDFVQIVNQPDPFSNNEVQVVDIQCSFIKWVEWNSRTKELQVCFKNNKTYTYNYVPEMEVLDWEQSDDQSDYFNRYIRDCY
jgi:hypothetical protein